MITGRIIGERVRASRLPFDLKTMPFANPLHKRMTEPVPCRHCPEQFTGDGRWNAYSRHIKADEHR